jgi:hypothetical protein
MLKFQQLNNSKFTLGTKIRGAKLRVLSYKQKEIGLFYSVCQGFICELPKNGDCSMDLGVREKDYQILEMRLNHTSYFFWVFRNIDKILW